MCAVNDLAVKILFAELTVRGFLVVSHLAKGLSQISKTFSVLYSKIELKLCQSASKKQWVGLTSSQPRLELVLYNGWFADGRPRGCGCAVDFDAIKRSELSFFQ
jgi:hypothetical protein